MTKKNNAHLQENDEMRKNKAHLQENYNLKQNYDEIDFVDGNYEDKYNAKNPISAMLVNGFLRNFKDLAREFETFQGPSPQDIVEIGAGEGHLLQILADMYPNAHITGCDLSERVNNLARERLSSYDNVTIQRENAEKVTFKNDSFNAAVCCEVLEHVEHPEKAIREFYRILKKGGVAIVSVPHEPIWRFLNMARLQYLKDFGNTPGHLNHWTRSQFKKFVRDAGFTVMQDQSPFPWSMLLIQKSY